MTDDGSLWAPLDLTTLRPLRQRASWRWTWRLAIACAVLDALALINSSTATTIKCDVGYVESDNLLILVIFVVPSTLAAVAVGAYTAVRDRQHRRNALILIAAVIATAAVALVVGHAWISDGPYIPCKD